MAENTAISWADDTFNPWEGCQKVSPACDGCYAEARNARYAGQDAVAPNWGPGAPRRRTSASNWAKPLKWEREQAATVRQWSEACPGKPYPYARFVFCASLADVFDNAVPVEWRRELFDLIHKTPHLTWLLLTKRPGNIVKLWAETFADESGAPVALNSNFWPRNAAIGCTVVTQEEADRDIPKLLAAKAALNPAFAFVSMEPLLGPVDLTDFLMPVGQGIRFMHGGRFGVVDQGPAAVRPPLDWVITGGETDQGSHKARPSHPDWFRSLRDQCAAAGVTFHHKQTGEWAPICWLDDGVTDTLYHPAPKRDPEAIRRCNVDHTVMNGDGSLHPGAWSPGTYRVQDRSMLMFKAGKKVAGRFLDGLVHDARPEVRHG